MQNKMQARQKNTDFGEVFRLISCYIPGYSSLKGSSGYLYKSQKLIERNVPEVLELFLACFISVCEHKMELCRCLQRGMKKRYHLKCDPVSVQEPECQCR